LHIITFIFPLLLLNMEPELQIADELNLSTVTFTFDKVVYKEKSVEAISKEGLPLDMDNINKLVFILKDKTHTFKKVQS